MSLDKFGRRSGGKQIVSIASKSSSSSSSFSYTVDGNIDIGNMKICNLKPPTSSSDATNKKYVDNLIMELNKKYQAVDNKIAELNTSVSRITPTAGKHLTNKKYVDDAIATTKNWLRADIKKASLDLEKKIMLAMTQNKNTSPTAVKPK
jgi:hypothetical protein